MDLGKDRQGRNRQSVLLGHDPDLRKYALVHSFYQVHELVCILRCRWT